MRAWVAALWLAQSACAGDDPPESDVVPSAKPVANAAPTRVALEAAPVSEPTRYPASSVLSPVTPAVATRLWEIAAREPKRRNDVFIKVGDSHTTSGNFLHCFAKVEPPSELLASVRHFQASFGRESLAAAAGKTAGWAILGNPSPLAQEIRTQNPRFAFVSFGSNDMEAGRNYATAIHSFHANLSTVLDELENAGVIPILSGLPPRGRRVARPWTGIYDTLTRGMAEARQIPYFSVYLANRALPDQGLIADRLHENVFVRGIPEPCNFTPEALTRGYNLRNLRSMQRLDLVKRILLNGVRAPDVAPAPIRGDGSRERPFEMDELPFTHHADSSRGKKTADRHPGCGLDVEEAGPEIFYRLTLKRLTAVRFLVFARGRVDVNLHLVGVRGACGERSIQRALPAGTHTLAVDSSTANSGQYLILAVRCEPGDVDCQ